MTGNFGNKDPGQSRSPFLFTDPVVAHSLEQHYRINTWEAARYLIYVKGKIPKKRNKTKGQIIILNEGSGRQRSGNLKSPN